MLKNVDWGGLTIVAILLGVLCFSPLLHLFDVPGGFDSIGISVDHPTCPEADQGRFIEFEKEFRKGYKLQRKPGQ
jgi:hypothetical protein